jgi:hypothetical protein
VAGVQTRLQPTILANLTSLGASYAVAWVVQACVAVLVAIIVWRCFRPGVTVPATAALLVGTFLATPSAFIYDMAMLTNAVLAVPRQSDRPFCALTIIETIARVLVLTLPIIMISYRLSVIRIVPLIALFGLFVWQVVRVRSRELSSRPPSSIVDGS